MNTTFKIWVLRDIIGDFRISYANPTNSPITIIHTEYIHHLIENKKILIKDDTNKMLQKKLFVLYNERYIQFIIIPLPNQTGFVVSLYQ